MFSFMFKNKIPVNSKLREYCIQNTNGSIRKITEKYNKHEKYIKSDINSIVITNREEPNLNLIPNPNPNPNLNPNPNPNDIIFYIICFFYSTTVLYYFIKFQSK